MLNKGMSAKDKIMKLIFLRITIVIFTLSGMFASCSRNGDSATEPMPLSQKTLLLLDWFEKNGNYINSPEIPSIMDAQNVWAMREENIHIIDLRDPEDFREGHIEHAVNLHQTEVLDYFISTIDPAAFKSIFFVCYDLSISGYVAGAMRLIGYDNVFAIRFGMSGWDRNVAEKYWLANTGNQLIGKLETKGFPKNKAGNFPALSAAGNSGFEIALERAREVLKHKQEEFTITIAEFLENPDGFYTICYWPEDKYMSNGHLQGAVQYDPKKSLSRDTYLNTLPLDKPTIVYCYSGQHSTFVAAYLRMLGYDSRSLAYGANAFIHEVMARTEPRPTRTFTENLIQNLPVVKGGIAPPVQKETKRFETITVEGGC
jgi:rhodanese-related sulfurtransferase